MRKWRRRRSKSIRVEIYRQMERGVRICLFLLEVYRL